MNDSTNPDKPIRGRKAKFKDTTQPANKRVELIDVRQSLINKLAEELGLSHTDISNIVDAQEEAIAITMYNGLMRDIRLPYIGAFKVNNIALAKIYEYNQLANKATMDKTKVKKLRHNDFYPHSNHWMQRFREDMYKKSKAENKVDEPEPLPPSHYNFYKADNQPHNTELEGN